MISVAQSRSPRSVAVRGCLTLLVSTFLLLGLGYWGYCWGWWGRTSLTLQYLFQCQCPPASEAHRYRPFTVLVSACIDPEVHRMTPSGRFLLVKEQRSFAHSWQIDLITNQRTAFPVQSTDVSHVEYLNDVEVLVKIRDWNGQSRTYTYLLIHLVDGTQVPIPWAYADAVDLATLNPQQVIFFRWSVEMELLFLGLDAPQQANQTMVVVTRSDRISELIWQHLADVGVTPETPSRPCTTGPLYVTCYSHDQRWYALSDGLYHAETQERMVATPEGSVPMYPHGWTPDNRTVVYSSRNNRYYLIDRRNEILFGGPSELFPVPQPILLAEVPETADVE